MPDDSRNFKQLREAVEIKIAGRTQTRWNSYEIDSDLLVPADAWRVELLASGLRIPEEVQPGAEVTVSIGGDVVMSGILDERIVEVVADSMRIRLSGRDKVAALLDCSAPLISRVDTTLENVVKAIVKEFGIGAYEIRADKTLLTEKFSIEPGELAWDALRRAAEVNGLWAWMEPNGTLVVGGPDYSVKESATLLMLVAPPANQRNNLLSLVERRSIAERFSAVKVYGQAGSSGTGRGQREARPHVFGEWGDRGVPVHRPRIVVDHSVASVEHAQALASKIISDGRVAGYSLTATVKGHRIGVGHQDVGKLWKPGQRVNLASEPHGVAGTYFLMGRRFLFDERGGQRTELTLKEDAMWLPVARPQTRRRKKHKGEVAGDIVPVWQRP